MAFFETVALTAAVALILIAAWQDFTTWKIRNGTVLALIGVYVCLAFARWISSLDATLLEALEKPAVYGDVSAALLLFLLGFALWMFKLLGAGDAKLFFPIGLFVGMNHLAVFAVILMAGAVIVSIALKFPVPIQYQAWPLLSRIEEIRKTRKVPYGVIMAAAAIGAMYGRYLGG